MSTGLPLGKLRALRRLADESGHFAMLAVDQRPPIARLIAARRRIDASAVAFADMVAVKKLVVEALGPLASAILLDPNFGFPAALERVPAHAGLVVTLEDHRFSESDGGRRSHSIGDWSVEKIKRAGADAVKVLAWYRPDASPEVREHQQRYVEAIGAQCRRFDIPFVLELLVYPLAQGSDAAPGRIDLVDNMPQLVVDSVAEFAHPRYGVDLFKLESPVPGATLPAPDGGRAHRAAQAWFDRLGAICREAGIPWVLLSAGVTAAQFMRVMEYGHAAGAHGFLAGRAIWWDPLAPFPDLRACADRLAEQGTETLRVLRDLTARAGNAWHPDYGGLIELESEGELCAAYAAT
ncbi:MAG TPA: tagatose 1,6-diphosphate aldolase [Casimicrobiaceae bacterium]